ncbi:MAG: Ca-activated chloride channel family protein [Granulosicoccus sp.]
MKRVAENNRQSLTPVIVLGLSFVIFPTLVLGGWSDWWSTPEQRALKLYESGNHDALVERSPNENWTALGHFQGAEFREAASSFAKSRQDLKAANRSNAATTALYNQGVSDVLSGEYEQAIERFDEVLSENPGFADSQYNRDIAKRLLELQETPEDSQDQSGEEGEQGDQDSEPSDSDESSENSENEPSDSADEDASDSEDASESENESEQNSSSSADEGSEGDSSDSASEQQQQQEEQQARDALAAEALQEQQEKSEEAKQMKQQAAEQPLTESEQATEQLLRRIPDDPRGLLRRKLEQSHRNEFPEVGDALEPW